MKATKKKENGNNWWAALPPREGLGEDGAAAAMTVKLTGRARWECGWCGQTHSTSPDRTSICAATGTAADPAAATPEKATVIMAGSGALGAKMAQRPENPVARGLAMAMAGFPAETVRPDRKVLAEAALCDPKGPAAAAMLLAWAGQYQASFALLEEHSTKAVVDAYCSLAGLYSSLGRKKKLRSDPREGEVELWLVHKVAEKWMNATGLPAVLPVEDPFRVLGEMKTFSIAEAMCLTTIAGAAGGWRPGAAANAAGDALGRGWGGVAASLWAADVLRGHRAPSELPGLLRHAQDTNMVRYGGRENSLDTSTFLQSSGSYSRRAGAAFVAATGPFLAIELTRANCFTPNVLSQGENQPYTPATNGMIAEAVGDPADLDDWVLANLVENAASNKQRAGSLLGNARFAEVCREYLSRKLRSPADSRGWVTEVAAIMSLMGPKDPSGDGGWTARLAEVDAAATPATLKDVASSFYGFEMPVEKMRQFLPKILEGLRDHDHYKKWR